MISGSCTESNEYLIVDGKTYGTLPQSTFPSHYEVTIAVPLEFTGLYAQGIDRLFKPETDEKKSRSMAKRLRQLNNKEGYKARKEYWR